MYESTMTFFLSRPRLLVSCGRTLMKAAAYLALLGLIGQVMKSVMSVTGRISQTPPMQSLAEAYGAGVTWFIPEGLIGFAVVLILAVTGLSAIRLGTELDRMSR